jgi:hypothetical protein
MSDSSTEIEPTASEAPVVAAADSTPAPVVAAEPTPADKPISLIDVVSKVLEPAPKPGVDAGTPTAATDRPKDGTETQSKPPEGAEPADISEEEMKRLSGKTQERIRWLAAQKADLTGKVEAATREVETYKPKAQEHDKLVGYLTRHGISSDEANNSLEITRLIKGGDYAGALKVMQPIYSELQRRAGEVLPPDLQEEVRLGHVPHDRALEISRARAKEAADAERNRAAETQRATEGQQQAWKAHVAGVSKAADDWAKAKAGSDPDWDKKTAEVTELLKLDILENGFPKSKEEAIQRSEKALERVNARWKSLRGVPVEIKAATGGGRASSTRDTPPKSALEAVNRALGG